MNSTFKVVFNKARGAFMAVNEITSSVQAKGTKTIVATAVTTLMACGAVNAATTTANSWDQVASITDKTSSTEFYVVTDTTSKTKTDLKFTKNTFTVNAGCFGSIAYLLKTHGTIENSVFSDNHTTTGAVSIDTSDKNAGNSMALGGVFMIKNGKNAFTDVVFQNNTLTSTGTGLGALVAGGAILQDAVINDKDGHRASALTIAISKGKDITYSGNNVISSTPDVYYGLYGTVSTAAGGFLFLDRDSKTDFDIGENAILHIGTQSATGNMDSIASSIAINGKKQETGIVKKGKGTLEINSSLDKFYGTVEVTDGVLAITKPWNVMNATTIRGSDSVLKANKITLTKSPTSLVWGSKKYEERDGLVVTTGSITVTNGGTLSTDIGSVFSDKTSKEDATLSSAAVLMKEGFSFSKDSTLDITDSGTYKMALYNSMVETSKVGTLNLVNASLQIENTDAVDNKVTINTNVTTKALDAAGDVKTIDVAADVTLTGDSSITGSQKLAGDVETLNVTANKTLAVKSDKTDGLLVAEINDIALNTGAAFIVDNSTISMGKLTVTGANITVGNSKAAGQIDAKSLELKAGSRIFLDPAWQDGSTIADASFLSAAAVSGNLAGQIAVGQNSVVALNSTQANAISAFNQLKDASDLTWGMSGVTAALYVASPVNVASTGSINVNGILTSASYADAGAVTVAAKGLLLVDQANVGSETVLNGASLTMDNSSYVGIINATDGTIKLADSITGTPLVVTDNQFVTGDVTDGVVTTTVDNQKLAGAVASMGVQQMARRADTVFANTIADRTAQSVAGEGVALWVDVGGERYEADDLDNGAQYKANMFYGAFGADVGVTPEARIGAAIQYGSGDSKSDNYGIKNDIDAVTFGLYGSYNVTGAAKIVGEFGWTHTTNDVTASERLLTNDFDADVLSLGVRGQHEFQVGAVKIVPSVGVRVSRISTDSFNVGGVKVDVDDQTIVQVPLSVAFAANSIDANGWKLNPYAKVSFTPTFGDDEINVRGYDQSALDTLPVQGNFGLSATNGNVTFGAALSAGFGQDCAKNFGGKVGVTYVF